MSQDTNGNLAAYDDDTVSNFVFWPEKGIPSKDTTAVETVAITLPSGA